MFSWRRSAAVILAGVMVGAPLPALADGVLAKIGGDYDQRELDRSRCRAIAHEARADELPGMEPVYMASGAQAGAYGVAGAAIANLIMFSIAKDRARGRAEAFCLNNLGYAIAPLNAQEAAAYDGLPTARREAFERTFLAQDLSDRLTPVLTPKVPPLPPFIAEPDAQGGLKLDVVSLAAADGPATKGGVVARAQMTRSRTAVLEAPFRSPQSQVMVAGEAGAVFHQVDYRTQRAPLLRSQGATWCGPVRQTTAQQSGVAPAEGAQEVYCFTSQPDGYDTYRPSGFAWLAGPYRSGFVLPRVTQPIILKERPQDDVGPIGLEIKIADLWRDRVVLEGRAARGERSVELWKRSLTFDAAGQAVLPLWSHRLVLQRSGEAAVTAVVDDRGDGSGWREDR